MLERGERVWGLVEWFGEGRGKDVCVWWWDAVLREGDGSW